MSLNLGQHKKFTSSFASSFLTSEGEILEGVSTATFSYYLETSNVHGFLFFFTLFSLWFFCIVNFHMEYHMKYNVSLDITTKTFRIFSLFKNGLVPFNWILKWINATSYEFKMYFIFGPKMKLVDFVCK